MSRYKFAEIQVEVNRLGPVPGEQGTELYSVRLANPDGGSWIESKVAKPVGTRTSGSDFQLAADMVDYMKKAADDPERWYIQMNSIGRVSPEELKATLDIAKYLSPYLDEASRSAHERVYLYAEHREGNIGPFDMGIARILQLPDEIRTPEDIAKFFAYLYLVDDVQFHPDDSFEQYIDGKGRPAFTPNEIEVRDQFMAKAFAISQKYGIDIYELGMWVGALTGKMLNPEDEASAPGWLKALSNTWI